MLNFIIKEPETEEEYKSYYYLRWKILRKPLGQILGEEKDENENQSIHIMIKELNENVIAVGRLHFIDDLKLKAQIRFMAVDSEYQCKGYGTLLIEKLEHVASEMGANKILLHARDSALSFYKKNGYKIKNKSHLLFNKIQHWLMIKNI